MTSFRKCAVGSHLRKTALIGSESQDASKNLILNSEIRAAWLLPGAAVSYWRLIDAPVVECVPLE